MSSFSQFAAGFCVVCIITGAISIITPEGSFKKPIKYVISLCFVAVVFGSVLNVNFPEIELDSKSTPMLNESAVRLNIEGTFSLALQNEGINFSKIEVLTDKTDEGSISIIEVIIYSNEPIEKIKSVIPETEQIKVSVVNE